MRMIAELMKHLEDLDGEDLKPKSADPMMAMASSDKMPPSKDDKSGIAIMEAKLEPKEAMGGSEKGPMEALLEKKDGGQAPKPEGMDDDSDLTDEELEELASSLG